MIFEVFPNQFYDYFFSLTLSVATGLENEGKKKKKGTLPLSIMPEKLSRRLKIHICLSS